MLTFLCGVCTFCVSKDMQGRLIVYTCEQSVNGCLRLRVSPVIDWQPVKLPCDPQRYECLANEEMDVYSPMCHNMA